MSLVDVFEGIGKVESEGALYLPSYTTGSSKALHRHSHAHYYACSSSVAGRLGCEVGKHNLGGAGVNHGEAGGRRNRQQDDVYGRCSGEVTSG